MRPGALERSMAPTSQCSCNLEALCSREHVTEVTGSLGIWSQDPGGKPLRGLSHPFHRRQPLLPPSRRIMNHAGGAEKRWLRAGSPPLPTPASPPPKWIQKRLLDKVTNETRNQWDREFNHLSLSGESPARWIPSH